MEFFSRLNLDSNASRDDVERSYKHFSRVYHPDKRQGTNDIFVEFKLAYDILSKENLFDLCKASRF